MPDTPAPPSAKHVLAGRYRLVRALARGGMAQVWEGYDQVLARPVAIKVLHHHLAVDEGFVERFRREAVAAARLTHPDIVATFDAGSDGDDAFIVMELVQGRTLREAIQTDGPFTPERASGIAIRVADALEHAHRAGLIHRDVKPANILLADRDGRVKVADFGIAKLQGGGDLTQTGAVVGTAKYLSPEQVEGRSPDARSDVYALGVVLYEMVCGRPPFEADTELATALQHVRAEASPPHRFRPGIPGALEAVVLRAMAKSPTARYQTAADLRGALVAAGATDGSGGPAGMLRPAVAPVVHRDPTPPSGITVYARPAGRRWLPLAALAALAALVIAVMVAVLPPHSPVRRAAGGGAAAAAGPLPVSSAHSFDPEGEDRTENEEQAANAIDGNPATAWASSHYTSRRFGNLKDGVGLVLQLPQRHSLRLLRVSSPTHGWAAQVYVANQRSSALPGWGQPVDTQQDIDGNTVFKLHGRSGAAVLLWITDLGADAKTEVDEISVES